MSKRPLPTHLRQQLRLLLLLALLPGVAPALDGVVEINQESVLAAGGFPFVIATPGSHALTGNLTVPAETQAIVIRSDDVVLDLRGFGIVGPHPCSSGGCAPGTIPGIGVRFESGGSSRITVRGGSIRGFPGTCILLGSQAYVTDMSVSACGSNGIQVSAGSLVRDNRVSDTGREGIVLVQEAGFTSNVVRRSGHAFQVPQASVRGGVPLGANLCPDGGCPLPARGFYLSTTQGNGVTAPDACDPGFHMASIPELLGGDLRYDAARGVDAGDSGSGPPADLFSGGYVRSGGSSGLLNCSGFTGTAGTGRLLFFLTREIDDGFGLDRVERVPRVTPSDCTESRPVWCVED